VADTITSAAPPGGAFSHLALFYGSTREYLTGVVTHVRESLRRSEPSFVAVSAAKVNLLREQLNGESARVLFADMTELGRNPARIIPRMRAFIDDHPGRRISYVGEPIWPSRSAAELREATRHEALLNVAFSGATATLLCPYDISALEPAVVADARRTHPLLLERGRRRASPEYRGPAGLPDECERPLPPPPADAESLTYTRDLRAARGLVVSYAVRAGATQDTVADLALAVGELAANTLQHAGGAGTLRIWHTSQEILCQVDDQGRIDDPLAGRLRPAADSPGGHGLWLVNQICDLVELRSGPAGTSIRLHLRRL
jgi:anti-sigma regulatory factor (Ser/Thr protein kinase)